MEFFVRTKVSSSQKDFKPLLSTAEELQLRAGSSFNSQELWLRPGSSFTSVKKQACCAKCRALDPPLAMTKTVEVVFLLNSYMTKK